MYLISQSPITSTNLPAIPIQPMLPAPMFNRIRPLHSLSAALACLAVFATAPGGLAQTNKAAAPQLAVYRWPNGTTNVNAFARWLNQPVVWGEDFAGSETWDNVSWPVWWLEHWGKWVKKQPGRRLIFGVHLLPGPVDGSGATHGTDAKQPVSLAKGANGEYNHFYQTLAENLVKHGLGDAILRPGWEFNGGWYTWRAKDNEKHFAEYWRQIVKTMRSVPGTEKLKFCWNPTLGYQQFPAEKAWPGDEFVDYVGLDVYDESWMPDGYPWPKDAPPEVVLARQKKVWHDAIHNGDHGLVFWSRFAAEHQKPFVIPEWGCNNRVDFPEQHGGLDNAYFVEQMHAFITDPKNHVFFHCYFDVQAPDGHHQLSPGFSGNEKTEFPNAAKKFRELFGK